MAKTRKLSKRTKKSNNTIKRNKRPKKIKEYKMNMSEKNYKKLLSKKRLSKNQRKKLDKALHIKYCNCIKALRYSQKNPAAYGICANSVYKNRGIEMPPNAANRCKKKR